MRRKRAFLILWAILAVVLFAFDYFIALAPPDPIYKGKHLSDYLLKVGGIGLSSGTEFSDGPWLEFVLPHAREPLRELGLPRFLF